MTDTPIIYRHAPTIVVTVYVGTFNKRTGRRVWIWRLERLIRKWCDIEGACVTVTRTRFIYTGGQEKGIAVGFINYPRFPSTPEAIENRAMALAHTLRTEASQWGVSVVGTRTTTLISGEEQDRSI